MARTGPAPADRAALPLQWPLVGRREEIELFETTLADPRAHGFVVNGAPGVGKTRLGDECLSVAHRQGRTAKEIAARLFLSTRTVNNHLQNVYTKLGISGRRELAEALGLDDPLSEPGR